MNICVNTEDTADFKIDIRLSLTFPLPVMPFRLLDTMLNGQVHREQNSVFKTKC